MASAKLLIKLGKLTDSYEWFVYHGIYSFIEVYKVSRDPSVLESFKSFAKSKTDKLLLSILPMKVSKQLYYEILIECFCLGLT